MLPALLDERSASRLTLGGLAAPAVAELVRQVARHPPADTVLTALQRRAEGNPLFVLELARLGSVSELALPGEVRDVIGRRLDRMPEQTRQVLRAAAVLGRELTVGLLAELTGDRPARVRDLVRPALHDELLTDGPGDGLRFAHALTHEVAYAELPATDRLRLHQRAADALAPARRPEGDPLLDARPSPAPGRTPRGRGRRGARSADRDLGGRPPGHRPARPRARRPPVPAGAGPAAPGPGRAQQAGTRSARHDCWPSSP